MIYHLYDLQHALLTPARAAMEGMKAALQNPFNPLTHTDGGRKMAAGAELFERMTRRFGRPSFDLPTTIIDGKKIKITEEDVMVKPFCDLLHFKRATPRKDPKVLVVAPMSGHWATLLRGTVEALLPHHDVYITNWEDARQIPLKDGRFNLDDYINYLRDFLNFLGPDVHVIAVCQPAVPVMAVTALMNNEKDPTAPRSMTLMGGPIDARITPTEVTQLAEKKPMKWFEKMLVSEVPFYYPGAHRRVYPGFLQLSSFMSMNMERHVSAHMDFYNHLVEGDGEGAEQHRKFYNEYMAVMDLPAEFYLQTVDVVFQRFLLPKSQMKWRDPETEELHDILPAKITKTALLTIEGELDDISAHGQTTAAHDICTGIPDNMQFHHFQLDVGHYGIFNGRRWREQIMPRIRHFIRDMDKTKADPVPASDLKLIPDLKPDRYNVQKHGIKAVRILCAEREKAREAKKNSKK